MIDTCNEISCALEELYGIIDSKYKRLASSLEFVKPGTAIINSDDSLTNYWEALNRILESYIDAVDIALDETKQKATLSELHTALQTIRNQFVILLGKIEDLIELIDIHDALTETGNQLAHGV